MDTVEIEDRKRMRLRKLEMRDAPWMLEWMHDENVVQYMKTDFASMSLQDCRDFIDRSQDDIKNFHRAIVGDEDQYLGTVSLKNMKHHMAEFAIAVRSPAMGTGIAGEAMREILRIGIEEKDLRAIYWYVSEKNKRAIRFYDKNGYKRADEAFFRENVSVWDGMNKKTYIWYLVKSGENN